MFEIGGTVFSFPSKKKKMTDEERLTRCRERNRVHAKNTRERKKEQNHLLEMQINNLRAATLKMREEMTDGGETASGSTSTSARYNSSTTTSSKSDEDSENMNFTFEKRFKSDAEDYDDPIASSEALLRFSRGEQEPGSLTEFSLCHKNDEHPNMTPDEIEVIRRERNRMHAKKTRMRKKKALAEMQQVPDPELGCSSILYSTCVLGGGNASERDLHIEDT
jgi:hypothetical protein